MNNLKEVLVNLSSRKITERQEALQSIRTVFAKDKVVANFHINRDGENNPLMWLPVFQALFSTAMIEKEMLKKATSAAAATRRLSETTSIIRWLTERSVHFLNRKVVSPLVVHLTQTLAADKTRNSRLFRPVALDYAKALKCLLSYTPHLEHLDPALWVKVMEVSFNVVLDDPVNRRFIDDDDVSTPSTPIADDDDMFVDDEPVDDSTPGPSNTTTAKGKKRIRDPTPVPILASPNAKSRSRRHIQTSVTSEQVEFASILSILIASPAAPILSSVDFSYLPTSILSRLQRFLERYPADSSLLCDYITILSATLDHLSLNKKYEVEAFARSTWVGLVGLWGTKDKRMKEGLVVVLRHLFQYVICPNHSEDAKLPYFDYIDGIGRLWRLLDAEAENKWGVDGLMLDALRLQIVGPKDTKSGKEEAFVARTFRAGWNFDAEQALCWAILELRADCAGKLFQLSESMQHSTPTAGPSHGHFKRIRLENPITSLLHSIQTGYATRVRNYHLQTLLFFVDRHWSLVHDSQKQEIIDTLLQFVAIEESTIQSWAFLNFAAIAHAEGSRSVRKTTDIPYSLDSAMWDSIWTHAVRRANAPAICRAACHAGQALLTSFYSHVPTPSQVLLTTSRVLLDIESFAKDMDIQGPSYPFDSVCIFLSQCLIVASQDARLHRMHFEDTVLNWFIGSWRLTHNRTKMTPYATMDILRLLGTICNHSKHLDLKFRPLLPKSEIVESIVRDNKTKIIRDFLLYAKIPVFQREVNSIQAPHDLISKATVNKMIVRDKVLQAPRARERRITAFFLKFLEPLISEWEGGDHSIHVTAEMARQSLDIVIDAIAFESLLVLNGVSTSRQVLQTASKIMSSIVRLLTDPNWSISERLLVAHGLEMLIPAEESSNDDAFREALSQPCPDSGIKEEILRRLLANNVEISKQSNSDQLDFLRSLWQNVELQDALGIVSETLRAVLEGITTAPSNGKSTGMEDRDGFGPIRTANIEGSTSNTHATDDDRPAKHIIEICVGVLACGPFLQSPSSKPTRDKELAKLLISSAENQPEKFCLVCPTYFSRVRQGTLALPIKYLDVFLDKFEPLLQQYFYSRSEPFQCILLDLLSCCLGVWKSDDSNASDVHGKFKQLCAWLSVALKTNKIRSWSLRDSCIRFIDKYLSEDPTQELWISRDDFDTEDEYRKCLPMSLLLSLNQDPDTRVRFRAALVNARLYSLTSWLNIKPIDLYQCMKDTYIGDVNNYEHMLTRILALGDIMIVSSAVRRGPYWHLLETFGHSHQYTNHIEAVLTGVAQRLGLSSLSALFQAYASQIAYSVRAGGADITTFPPHVLGYRDRRQSVEAAFRLFTPTNILNNGRTQFESHCKMLQKDVADGLQDCFGEIVGLCIAGWLHVPEKNENGGKEKIDGNDQSDDDQENEQSSKLLEEYLKGIMLPLDQFWPIFEKNIDGIVVTILQCLGDQDYSQTGPIVAELQKLDQGNKAKTASVFSSLVIYRSLDKFKPHQYNLPSFCTKTILRSFLWISSRVPSAISKSTTYHVLHLLVDAIHHTPLVNEQHRLINAMTLWMAYRRHDLEDLPILHTVIHSATSFFAQSDLARSAQSILEVAFWYYRALKFENGTAGLQNSPLSNFLVRICCIAHDYAFNSDDPTIREMGKGLLEWIDQQTYLLSKVSIFSRTIARALAAWPHQPSAELLPLYEEIMLGDLASILEDHHRSSNKFRLVRRIKEQTLQGHDKENLFSERFFWRLKEYMPSSDRLQDEDVAAFTQLLTMNYGKISSFSPEQPDLNSPRARQRRIFRRKGAANDVLAQDAVTLGLLMMLQDDDPGRVSNAYQTLKLIMSISSGEPGFIPTGYRDEIAFYKVYRRLPMQRPVPNIKEMLTSDTFLESASDFREWVSILTVLLSDTLAVIDPFFAQLTSILMSDTAFAEQILPILVYTVLALQEDKKLTHVSESLRHLLSTYFTTILSSTDADLSCVQCIVDIALHLRYFTSKTNDALAYNGWLNIDYALLARSSVSCGAYTTALLFVEISSEQKHDDRHDATTEQVMYEIYAHIDEPDGFYGIKTNNLQQFLIKRLHHEKQWDKAFRFHGAALEAGNSRAVEEEGLLESFHYFGFDHLAIDTLRNLPGQSSEYSSSTSMNYKLAWRTETWDLPDQPKDSASAAFYRSLRAIYRERDSRLVDSIIQSAFFEEMSLLRSLGSENLAEIRTVSQDLMCLGEILQWRQGNPRFLLNEKEFSLDSWKEFMTIAPAFRFSDLESLMATRISLVRSMRQQKESQQIGNVTGSFIQGLRDVEKGCLLRLSEAARASGQIQIALNSVIRAQQLDLTPSAEVSEEFANVLWVQREEKLAVQFLRHLIENDSTPDNRVSDVPRKAIWLSRLGTWTSEACLEKPAEIWDHYFDPSIELLETVKATGRFDPAHATIYRQCAMFAERQYHSALKSPDGFRYKVLVERETQELKQLESYPRSNLEYSRRKNQVERQLKEDSEHYMKHNDLRDASLKQAIDMYARCLEASSQFDSDSAIRFCSLWLANFDAESILPCVEASLERIPSRKLVFLAHQLTARLANAQFAAQPQTQENLHRLILRICQEHPFHILYQVYCLSDHSHFAPTGRRHLGQQASQTTQTERGTAASALLDRLRIDQIMGQRVRDVEKLCDACLEWAKYPIKDAHKKMQFQAKQKGVPFKIPNGCKILGISNLRVPVVTARTPLDPTMQYKDCVWILRYDPTFDTAGGNNLPKINVCRGSDGQQYKQLFKGEGQDDLRQDAVMEQVFELVNGMLKHDRETLRRDLKVRDYKVIPLDSQAGIMEFVGNTAPLREWMMKSHPIYNPNDIKYGTLNKLMGDLQKKSNNHPDIMLPFFLKNSKKFRPIMRHYFTEKHKNPINWFQMRLCYTRSVATTSIVGHILGLGDRHSSNILLDNVTGEVVHIDLGIAFDQGKHLTIPEKVPFRMTANVIDGMGPSGTMGVFQRCAEETLRVLREESELIMTILEVFKHDPLHSWTASEDRVKQAQELPPPTEYNLASGSANEAADRALNSVARKLDKSLSVESTVNELLAEATDPTNLATIFVGWFPFM